MYSSFFKFENAPSGIARSSLPFKKLKEMQNGDSLVQGKFNNYISSNDYQLEYIYNVSHAKTFRQKFIQ